MRVIFQTTSKVRFYFNNGRIQGQGASIAIGKITTKKTPAQTGGRRPFSLSIYDFFNGAVRQAVLLHQRVDGGALFVKPFDLPIPFLVEYRGGVGTAPFPFY